MYKETSCGMFRLFMHLEWARLSVVRIRLGGVWQSNMQPGLALAAGLSLSHRPRPQPASSGTLPTAATQIFDFSSVKLQVSYHKLLILFWPWETALVLSPITTCSSFKSVAARSAS
jgi:hypothetical protein